MVPRFKHCIAIDVGGTYIKGAILTNQDSLPKVPHAICNTNHVNGANGVINQIIGLVDQLVKERKPLNGDCVVSLSIPGLIDSKEGIVRLALNLPEWKNIPISHLISTSTKFPVVIENDANCGALGEWHFRYQRKISSLVYVTVSTGIGAGIIIGSQLIKGASGGAGEFGHISVDLDGPVCHECGISKGCLTTFSSGKGILNYVKDHYKEAANSILSGLCGDDPRKITEVVLEQAANLGDDLAITAYKRAGHSLGQGLVNLIHLLDPEIIVLGGGVLKAENWLYPSLMETLDDRLLDKGRIGIVRKASLGDMQGIAGSMVNAQVFG